MAIRTELILRLPNTPGALAGVCRLLAAERVNILAMTLESSGLLRLVVDNPVRATGALRASRYPVAERDVMFVATAGGPGSLVPVLNLIAEGGANLEYAYGGSADASANAAVVLGVDDPRRVAAASGV
jgi:hypothetical protein